ncbi:ORF6N domain-containing protein [Lysinibacillus sp. NPDC097279]|uniref:ORF6N domain-containing protein n=1 Tax=Lysinibacillus sp. NPDC097279 TaxID=3364143 RepID=UPI0038146C16
MNPLQVIVHDNQRVLTTAQIADSYGAEEKLVQQNFSNNKERYKVGKHFFYLQGEELKAFKDHFEILGLVKKNTASLYLWTEKGAWLHAKSLNTDRAWDAYEKLVDEYYNMKEKIVPLSKDQALVTVLRTTADLVEDTQEIKKEQHEIRRELSLINEKVEEQITLTSGEQRAVQKAVATKVYEFDLDPSVRPKLFRELYREIKDRFAVASYKDIRRQDLQLVLGYINSWIPRKVTLEEAASQSSL